MHGYALQCRVVETGGSGLPRDSYRTFKYLAGFVRQWSRLELSDQDLHELERIILTDPDAGALVPATGGLRKLRFAPSRWRRGKRGTLRVGYSPQRAAGKSARHRRLREEREVGPDARRAAGDQAAAGTALAVGGNTRGALRDDPA